MASVPGGDRHGPLPVFGFSWDRQLSPGSWPRPRHPPHQTRGKPLAFGICHAGVLELALAPRNRVALYSLPALARWFPLIHR